MWWWCYGKHESAIALTGGVGEMEERQTRAWLSSEEEEEEEDAGKN